VLGAIGEQLWGQLTGVKSLTDVYNGIILLATLSRLSLAFLRHGRLIFIQRDQFRAALAGQYYRMLAFIFSINTIIGAGAQTVLYGFVLLLAGIPVYVWLKRTSSAPGVS
jgi:hypothetical protein